MAEKFRSVLEKYDAKGNRQLPTPEEQAIERDTTLEGLLIGPGRAAASAIKNAINKKAQSRKFDTPKIGSNVEAIDKDRRLVEEYRTKDWSKTPFGRNPFPEPSPKELERIAKQKDLSKIIGVGEDVGYKAVNNASGQTGFDIGSQYAEANKQNAAGDTYKKGGKVKASSASRRADGIAQRGKTRGRMV